MDQCFRVGEDSSSVRVEPSIAHIPRIIAVAKWILGKPPDVWGVDGSRMAVSDLASATVVEKEDMRLDFQVLVCQRVESWDQLTLVEGGPASGKDNL